jgi:hypothetical protein
MRSGIRIRDGKNLDLGTGVKDRKKLDLGSGKHPGSATLVSETLYLPVTLALLHKQLELIPWKFLHSLKV